MPTLGFNGTGVQVNGDSRELQNAHLRELISLDAAVTNPYLRFSGKAAG
jgi:hypothetical protein